jgi:predicted dehydrogenase
MPTAPKGVALIGTGGVAQMHANALREVSGAHLIGAFSRSPENVARFSDQFETRGYRALDELLSDPQVEVVSVLTPVANHVEMALTCLQAGKHVLVEKPVGRTAEEIRTLTTAAAKAGRLCVPMHNYIYSPAIQRAKQLIDQGKLGRLSSLWMIYNQKHDADMGWPDLLLRELHIHHAYVTLFLAGRPIRVGGLASNIHFSDPSAPDQAMVLCELPGGAIANLWGSFGVDDRTSNPWSVYYKVLGTEGGFTHSWDDCYSGDAKLPGWDKTGYRDSFLHLYDHFFNRCVANGDPPLSGLDDAVDALRIIEATEAAVEKRTFVDVDYA